MTSTKIVIIVLVLVGLIFVVFVAGGAFRGEKPPAADKASVGKTPERGWTKSIKSMFKSFQPTLKLKQKCYTATANETIPPDAKHAFRTATFHWLSGTAEISYEDKTPMENGSPLKKMDNPQKCKLRQDPDPDVKDRDRCSIIAFKSGGTFTFNCTGNGVNNSNAPCRVEVEEDGCQ